MIIRPAIFNDVSAMIQVKESLAFTEPTETSTNGGFLLGADKKGMSPEYPLDARGC